jgi:hypothetical protein
MFPIDWSLLDGDPPATHPRTITGRYFR